MAKCKGCGAEIAWVQVESGKLMPVDPPSLTVVTKEGKVITGQQSHFASCPKASTFRSCRP